MRVPNPTTDDPVLARALRSRWQSRSWVMMLGYLSVLVGAAVWIHAAQYLQHPAADPTRRMARAGHDLFFNMTWMQTLCWMLLAPALTATSIAGEREHGLLEALQLSPLAPSRIIGGKLLGALLFAGLMLLATLPITAICFIMGGVSPEEFRTALLLQMTTAATGATVGLFCSAHSRRANTAMAWTFTCLLLWGLSSYLAFFLWITALASTATPTFWERLAFSLTGLFGRTNPLFSSLLVADPALFARDGLVLKRGEIQPWMVSLAFQLLLCPLLFWHAVCAVRKPLPEPAWLEAPQRTATQRKMPWRRAAWRTRRDNAAHQPDTRSEKSLAPQTAENQIGSPASRRDLPLAARIRFSNPVLQREVRGRLRLRKVSRWNGVVLLSFAIFLLYNYARMVQSAILDPGARDDIWTLTTMLVLIVIMVAATLQGAGGFAREREGGTWEGIRLSLLSRRAVLGGKMLAPLLALLLYSVPLWPVLALCLLQNGITGAWPTRGVPPVEALLTIGVLGATAWFCVAWGLWVSWHCERIAAAVGRSVTTLFVLMVFVPTVALMIDSSMSGAPHRFLMLWHPFFALSSFGSSGPGYDPLRSARWCAVFLFATGCGLLLMLNGTMRREMAKSG